MGQAQGSEFAYDVGESVSSYAGELWSFHQGTGKRDGSQVSVFQFKKANNGNNGKIRAENAVKKLRTIKHPGVLRYIDSVDLEDSMIMVTEPVQPIHEMIDEMRAKPQWIGWGLQNLIETLKFLSENCHFIHGQLLLSSIFITPAGEWKLGGLEFLGENNTNHFLVGNKQSATQILPKHFQPPEYSLSNWKPDSGEFDLFQLGCLIYEIFNGPATSISEDVPKKIPKQLWNVFKSLVSRSPNSRGQFADILRNPFFKNPLSSACNFIDNIALKEKPERDNFFQTLSDQLSQFPTQVCKGKILPALVGSLDYGPVNARVLGPILKIGSLLSSDEYSEKITPHVAKWFASPDRALRLNLLQNISSFSEHLTATLINDQIFPNVAQGFMDTNPKMRELTVISVVHLVPKMDKKIISNLLLKALAKMQVDPEPGIRTNTTICLSKISAHLPADQQQRILIPAFSRALGDPFVHARVAAVMSLAATQQYYDKDDIAKKIIPALSVCCVDPEEKVRKNALNAIKSFLSKLEFLCENPNEGQNTKQERGMFGWALSSFTKFYKPNPGDVGSPSASDSTPTSAPSNKSQTGPAPKESSKFASEKVSGDWDDWDENDDLGGDQDDGFESPLEEPGHSFASPSKPSESMEIHNQWDNWNDEEFDVDDEPAPKPSSPVKPAASIGKPSGSNRFVVDDEEVDENNGWGDSGWGDGDDEEDWDFSGKQGTSKLEQKKLARKRSAKDD